MPADALNARIVRVKVAELLPKKTLPLRGYVVEWVEGSSHDWLDGIRQKATTVKAIQRRKRRASRPMPMRRFAPGGCTRDLAPRPPAVRACVGLWGRDERVPSDT